ncbi:MAG: nuclear transport factor 2 family protein [Myxococcales bacterium]|nr:nuclear transport factor 2 family protein [Myxococcales bacterium]MDH3484829.1 nuclear transport factor 2 family protein [Myxococcales bacterium]
MSHDVADLDRKLNAMIASGQVMEAFEKFYADDCIMQENSDKPREGKPACRQYEIDFFGSVEEFHEGTLLGSAVEGDRSFSEWVFDVTFKDGSRMRNHEVSARRWADGKVVFEQFFYQPNITPAD